MGKVCIMQQFSWVYQDLTFNLCKHCQWCQGQELLKRVHVYLSGQGISFSHLHERMHMKYCYLEPAWTCCRCGYQSMQPVPKTLQIYILPVVTVVPDDHTSGSMLLQWHLLSRNSNMSHTQTDLNKSTITLAYSIPDM